MSASQQPARLGRVLRNTVIGLAFTAAVVFLLLLLAGVFHRKIGDAAHAAEVAHGRPVGEAPLVAVERIEVPVIESAVGSIRPVYQTAIASKLQVAKVVAVNVRAGQEVNEGDLLIQLDDEDLHARLQQAEAAVAAAQAGRDRAQLDFDRIQRLYEQGNASKVEYDRAETDLRTAVAELDRAAQAQREAETVLSYATIRSPLSGRVVDKTCDVGDTVHAGQTLLTLYDRMQLVANVRESLAQTLHVGQTLPVEIPALDKTCDGTVSEIVPEAAAASRSFQVKVTGPCPPGMFIGMYGRLMLPLGTEQVTVVPRDAVRRIGQLDMVDVALPVAEQPTGERRLFRRAVQLGRTFGDNVEVLAGLAPGEQVALAMSR